MKKIKWMLSIILSLTAFLAFSASSFAASWSLNGSISIPDKQSIRIEGDRNQNYIQIAKYVPPSGKYFGGNLTITVGTSWYNSNLKIVADGVTVYSTIFIDGNKETKTINLPSYYSSITVMGYPYNQDATMYAENFTANLYTKIPDAQDAIDAANAAKAAALAAQANTNSIINNYLSPQAGVIQDTSGNTVLSVAKAASQNALNV